MLPLLFQLFLQAQSAPDATTQSIEKQQQEERLQAENDIRGMKNLGTLSIEDLVRFRLVDGLVSVDSPMKPTGDVTCTIRGLPGIAIFSLTRTPPAGGPTFTSFKFIHRDFSQKGCAVVQTSVFAAPASVQIARDVEMLEENTTSISLVQTPGEGGHGNVRLYVQGNNSKSGQRTLDVKVEADDLVQLRRKYPHETAVYLLPLMHDLHADQALYFTDVRAEWQILGGSYNAPPELKGKIDALIKQLDSDSPAERRAALKEMQELGEPAALAVMRMDRAQLSPEQNSSLDAFLTPFAPLPPADVKRLGNDPDFLLDCLMSDDPVLRNRALQRLRGVMNKKMDIDPNADQATRLAMVMKLHEQTPAPATQPSVEPSPSAAPAQVPAER